MNKSVENNQKLNFFFNWSGTQTVKNDPFFFLHTRFQVKKKQFFRNFMTIMLFGAVGTLISFVIISAGMIENSDVLILSVMCITKTKASLLESYN